MNSLRTCKIWSCHPHLPSTTHDIHLQSTSSIIILLSIHFHLLPKGPLNFHRHHRTIRPKPVNNFLQSLTLLMMLNPTIKPSGVSVRGASSAFPSGPIELLLLAFKRRIPAKMRMIFLFSHYVDIFTLRNEFFGRKLFIFGFPPKLIGPEFSFLSGFSRVPN